MTTKTMRGLMVAAAAVAMLASHGALADSKPTTTADVAKGLTDAKKAADAKDWATAKAAVDAASKLSDRKPFDDYEIASFSMFIDAQTNDFAGAAAAAQFMADSPVQPDADKAKNLKIALSLSLKNKQYDKGLAYAKAIQATNPTDPSTISMVAQAYYFAKDYASAVALAQKQVDAAIAAHQAPDRNTLDLLVSAQSEQKDEAGVEKTMEMLVQYYNDPNDWVQIIDISFGTKGIRDLDGIWLGRLLFLTGATVSSEDASMFGGVASHLTFYGDAQTAQEHGGTGFPDAKTNAAKDKATIQQQIAAGPKQSGLYNAKLAEALYSYGMYKEAEDAATLAVQKGDAVDPTEPPMVLAQAQIAQGKYDEGIANLSKITGGGPATPRVVRLWIDYANSKKNPATAAK